MPFSPGILGELFGAFSLGKKTRGNPPGRPTPELDFGPFRVRFGPFRVRLGPFGLGPVSGPFQALFGVLIGVGSGRGFCKGKRISLL